MPVLLITRYLGINTAVATNMIAVWFTFISMFLARNLILDRAKAAQVVSSRDRKMVTRVTSRLLNT